MSTKTIMRVVLNGLLLTPESVPDVLAGYQVGESVKVEIKQFRGRHAAFHRKFFVLINSLYGYWEHQTDYTAFRQWVTMRAGWVISFPDGTELPVSISFENMEQQEFERLYSACVDFAIGKFLPATVGRDELDQQVENILMGFG